MPVAFRLLKDFDDQRKQKDIPKLDPDQWSDLDIDPGAWRD